MYDVCIIWSIKYESDDFQSLVELGGGSVAWILLINFQSDHNFWMGFVHGKLSMKQNYLGNMNRLNTNRHKRQFKYKELYINIISAYKNECKNKFKTSVHKILEKFKSNNNQKTNLLIWIEGSSHFINLDYP